MPSAIGDTKVCGRCQVEQPVTEFTKSRNRKDGLSPMCKLCAKKHHLQKVFGLTLEEYDDVLAKQEYRCAICGRVPERNIRPYNMDHDAAHCPLGSGCKECIRGILCVHCNRNVGWLEALQDEIAFYLIQRPLCAASVAAGSEYPRFIPTNKGE